MNKRNENITLFIRIILIIGIIVWIGFSIRQENKRKDLRLKNGKDVIEYNDSTYYISFKIDSVKSNPPEPDDRYR